MSDQSNSHIKDDILGRIIELARLDPLAPGMAVQKDHLKKILDNFRVLRNVKIEGVEPITLVNQASLPLRDDVVDDTFTLEEATANARLKLNEFFLAPRVLGKEDTDKNTGR